MKTLIFNGSPRINGDTGSLINEITEKIAGEYRIVNAYRCKISALEDENALLGLNDISNFFANKE